MTKDQNAFLSNLERVSIGSLTEDIAIRLRQAIAGGHYAPGDMLPTEAALVEKMGVSRTVVREAMSQLKAEGLLVSRRGKGTYIGDQSSMRTVWLRPSASALDDIRHLFEVRSAIEVGAAERAAVTWTPADLAAIASAMDEIRAAMARDENGSYADYAFHQAIAEAAHNPYFSDLLNYLRARLSVALRAAWENSRAIGKGPGPGYSEHDAIFRAIVARDPLTAGQAVRNHLVNAVERLGLT